jgi:hypothetical protein
MSKDKMSNTTLQHKRTSVSGNVPEPEQLEVGEIALNLADKIIFTKDGTGQVLELSNPEDYLHTTAYGFDNIVDSAAFNKLTVGPDSADDAKLYFETGADTHTLEGREGGIDMDAWIAYNSSDNNNRWKSVTYGNGKFVAVSSYGSNRVMYSEDAMNWTGIPAGDESSTWSAVTYADGKFVAVAYSGIGNRVMHSTDGINWTGATAANPSWNSVAYGNGKFVAVAYGGTNRIMYSTDGINWTAVSGYDSNNWQTVVYGNGKFVAVSNVGDNRVMYSTDGITWTVVPSSNDSNSWRSVTYGAGKFVAVASGGINRVMYSTDGITWTGTPSSNEGNSWDSITYGNGKFVVVATGGTDRIMYSEDAITWTGTTSTNERNNWDSIVYADGKFVAVASNGTNQVMVLDAPEDRSGLYYDNELIATEVNLQPLFDKVNNLSHSGGSLIWSEVTDSGTGEKIVRITGAGADTTNSRNATFRYDPANNRVYQNIYHVTSNKIWADEMLIDGSLNGTGKITAKEIEVETLTSTVSTIGVAAALEQVVLGSIVVGNSGAGTFSDSEQTSAMAITSAFKVVKPNPITNNPDTTVDLDKDGNIYLAGSITSEGLYMSLDSDLSDSVVNSNNALYTNGDGVDFADVKPFLRSLHDRIGGSGGSHDSALIQSQIDSAIANYNWNTSGGDFHDSDLTGGQIDSAISGGNVITTVNGVGPSPSGDIGIHGGNTQTDAGSGTFIVDALNAKVKRITDTNTGTNYDPTNGIVSLPLATTSSVQSQIDTSIDALKFQDSADVATVVDPKLPFGGSSQMTILHASWDASGGTTIPTILSSYGISNITRISEGRYQVDFMTNMVNANYTVTTGCGTNDYSGTGASPRTVSIVARANSSVTVLCERTDDAVNEDNEYMSVMIIGNQVSS